MKIYYIYHLIGKKIGCTTTPYSRIAEQNWENWEILELYTDIDIASRRERELQKQYGYKLDKILYSQTKKNRKPEMGGAISGKSNVENGHLDRIRRLPKKMSKKSFERNMKGAHKTAAKINTCPFCGRNNLKGNIALGNHKKKCKMNPIHLFPHTHQ